MNNFLATVALLFGLSTVLYGKLADISPILSPDGKHAVSMRLIPAKDLGPDIADSTLDGAKVPVLFLQDGTTKTNLEEIRIPDADDTDHRNSVDLSWSPDGRVLILQLQIGQISQFTLYRVASGKLLPLEVLPTPNDLSIHSEHQKSRGGIYIDKWIGPDAFIATDTISDAQYTFRITKQWKLQTIASKSIEP